MVVNCDGDNLLSVLLTNDILIKLLLNLVRCRNILEVDERNLLLTLLLFLDLLLLWYICLLYTSPSPRDS